jgi:uncharacterized RDD family membrane protein YckC
MPLDLDPASAGRRGAPRYAGFWIRVAANLLDVLILAALNMAAVLLTPTAPVTRRGPEVQLGPIMAPLLVIGFWIAKAATPGKMILGLRIIDSRTGRAPSVWQCVGRYVIALVSVACAGLGYFWIPLDARKQAWHDKVVGTVVIRTRG